MNKKTWERTKVCQSVKSTLDVSHRQLERFQSCYKNFPKYLRPDTKKLKRQNEMH